MIAASRCISRNVEHPETVSAPDFATAGRCSADGCDRFRVGEMPCRRAAGRGRSPMSNLMDDPLTPDWFDTPLGRYLLAAEQTYFDAEVVDVIEDVLVSPVGIEPTTNRLRERLAIVRGVPSRIFAFETRRLTSHQSASFQPSPPSSVSVSVSTWRG